MAILGSVNILGIKLDVHTLLVSSTTILVGLQVLLLGVFTKIFISRFNLLPIKSSKFLIINRDNLAYIVLLGLILVFLGAMVISIVIFLWYQGGFGDLDYRSTMRTVIPAILCILLGVQLIFNSFFLGVLLLPRKS